MFINYYKLLDVSINASHEEIKKAYRVKSKIYHPDSGGNDKDFILLTKAYDTLINSKLRSAYNDEFNSYYAKSNGQTNKSNFESKKNSESSNHQDQHRENFNQENNRDHATHPNQDKNKFMKSRKKSLQLKISFALNVLFFILIAWLVNELNTQDHVVFSLEDKIEELTNEKSDLITEKDKLTSSIEKMNTSLANQVKELQEKQDSSEVVDVAVSGTSLESSESEIITEETKAANAQPEEGYFTLGSSVEVVKQVMGGPPTSISEYSMSYDLSTIDLEDGTVSGWSNLSDNLMVKMEKTSEQKAFRLGSTVQDVINTMGTPTGYSDYSLSYVLSRVSIDNGIVTGWSDLSSNLKVQ
ncbi:J domain-containing protein [Bacillus sp. SJS]|uniref:J domain-containing protein n=1 Tax=Bacillus sp. SJS TaxID=1423321 RepID=UPI0004DCC77F|nr:J domain-containing protein [Bacillus sp. SJS]KZZ85037.1 hypothetical protein AS29_008290 [Bacillus sp. SJS]